MAEGIKIGWAYRDITPDRPVLLRGLFHLRVASRANDPLTLTALVLDGAKDQVVFVSVDAAGVHEEVLGKVRDRVDAAAVGLSGEKVVASATHTHTAPFAGTGGGLQREEKYIQELQRRYPDYLSRSEYGDLLAERLFSAVMEAWENRMPGSLAWGYGYAVVGENRRIRFFDDRSVMYGNTHDKDFSHVEGHVDHGVNLLYTYDQEGALTGALIHVACPAQTSEGGQNYVSSDFWHETRLAFRERMGETLFLLPQCGAAGDQSPHRLLCTKAEDRMLWLKYGKGLDKSFNVALRKDIARRITDAVEDAESYCRKDRRDCPALEHRVIHLDLPHWDVTQEEAASIQEEMDELQKRMDSVEDPDLLGRERTALHSRMAWCQRALDRYAAPPKSFPVQMNVIRIGEVAFVSVPFEYYLDFGDRIKGRSEALQTFVVQLAGNGTYLPTKRAASGKSYGAVAPSCRISPQGGQLIVEEAVAAIQDLFGG